MTETAQGFVPGMRASGECPHHPGQPYYHCPECSKERRQGVGSEIADSLERPQVEQSQSLVPDPVPVHITQRARDHLLAAIRDFRRSRIEGRVQNARERLDAMPPAPDPETEASQRHLDKLEADAVAEGIEVDDFDVVVLVFLDVTGISGIHPKIELAEPSKVENFERDYRIYEYGTVRAAVELQHMNYLRGLVIEWHDRLDKSGFVITHQNGDWRVEDR